MLKCTVYISRRIYTALKSGLCAFTATPQQALERRIAERGYGRVVIETASVLKEACQLYRSSGYLPLEGVETARCDMRMYKDIGSSGNNKAHHNKATTEK